jgi:serine/threonine protein kinase
MAETLGGDRYVVRGQLGEGAQGITYDAVDRGGRPVAIKRFDVRGAKSWKEVELAEREARVLATIDHPLVPRYLEHFEEDGHLYLVMEKIEGETLEELRKRQGALPEAEVRRFLACADRALTYLHGRASPIVHRDIKPRNVVKKPDGTYVLVDFGAVSELILRRHSSTIVGTIGYMAPEQFQGRAMSATDVYAVGATALAALTGKDPDTLPHQGLRVDVRAALAGRVTEEMILILERMLEPDPDRRPKTLAAALDGTSSLPPSPSPPPAIPLPLDRAREDAQVKSLRSLLFLLWGLGWVIVPISLAQLHAGRLIPIVMFTSLAAIFVLIWHKGALLRAILRRWFPAAASERPRVAITEPSNKVRVHASELRPEDVVGDTELGTGTSRRALRRR